MSRPSYLGVEPSIEEATRRRELLCNCLKFISQVFQLIRFSPKRLNVSETICKSVTLSEIVSGFHNSLSVVSTK